MIKLSQNWEAVLWLMATYKHRWAENWKKVGMSCTLTNNGCTGSYNESNKIRTCCETVRKEKTKLQIFIYSVSLTLNIPRTIN